MHLKVCVGECHYKQPDVAGIPKGKARSDEAAKASKSHITEGLNHSEAFRPDPINNREPLEEFKGTLSWAFGKLL